MFWRCQHTSINFRTVARYQHPTPLNDHCAHCVQREGLYWMPPLLTWSSMHKWWIQAMWWQSHSDVNWCQEVHLFGWVSLWCRLNKWWWRVDPHDTTSCMSNTLSPTSSSSIHSWSRSSESGLGTNPLEIITFSIVEAIQRGRAKRGLVSRGTNCTKKRRTKRNFIQHFLSEDHTNTMLMLNLGLEYATTALDDPVTTMTAGKTRPAGKITNKIKEETGPNIQIAYRNPITQAHMANGQLKILALSLTSIFDWQHTSCLCSEMSCPKQSPYCRFSSVQNWPRGRIKVTWSGIAGAAIIVKCNVINGDVTCETGANNSLKFQLQIKI